MSIFRPIISDNANGKVIIEHNNSKYCKVDTILKILGADLHQLAKRI